ncbi:alpha/beta hydrolase family protein [Emticicia sp. SJ17W-69]|uniref:alpha/beta hydrolase family protein n=1 Tax=Emticicia sp. SJ17W-69 TaxID=3421657 RepID=UPI003EBF75DB
MKKLTGFLMLFTHLCFGQAANYDESKMPPFTLPDVLTAVDGQKIQTVPQWEANRPALLKLFAENVYGTTPKLALKQHFVVTKTKEVFAGKAIQKQVSIVFDDYPNLNPINILLYVPKEVKNSPVFIGLNFEGNHSLILDNDIPITKNWMLEYIKDTTRVKDHQALEGSRGTAGIETWPFEEIISAGFAVATAYYGDIEPDYAEGWKTSLRGVIGKRETNTWGAMGAWAWGLSRMLDYVQTDKDIDGKKAIVVGHSRLGKAAFWAAAQDTRFAAYISNESGEGGAALARRWYGETVEIINKNFPHWFCEKFKTYNQNVNALPTDQHQLVALIAPRPIYISSAKSDQWSDPTGEFLSLKNAEPVYQLYGKNTLTEETRPPINQPIGSYIRYHYRSGKHNMTNYDWQQYLKFAAEVVR